MRLGGFRILVIEDEAILAIAIEDMLEELGCETVGPALSLAQAQRLAAEDAFDAAVLDINLAGQLSHPVAQLLRERGIPFCFSTGYESADIPEGFEDVPLLRKPHTVDRLGAVLERLLPRRAS